MIWTVIRDILKKIVDRKLLPEALYWQYQFYRRAKNTDPAYLAKFEELNKKYIEFIESLGFK